MWEKAPAPSTCAASDAVGDAQQHSGSIVNLQSRSLTHVTGYLAVARRLPFSTLARKGSSGLILLDLRTARDYASFMNLLLVGDGSTYIDLGKAQEFDVRKVKYYKSEDGTWVYKQVGMSRGQATSDSEVFKAFMNAHLFTQARENFPELFEHGSKVTAAVEQDRERSGSAPPTEPTKRPGARSRSLLRFIVGLLVGLAVAAYVAAVVTGKISANRQISIVSLVVIVVGVIFIGILIRPEVLSNIQEFGIGGLSVKMRQQLQQIQDTQEDQGRNLEEIHLILETLVTTSELSHLRKLADGHTANYRRNPSLLAELRRLRDVGLIETKDKGRIGHLPEKFDLADYVELTLRGEEYLQRIKQVEAPSSAPAQPKSGN